MYRSLLGGLEKVEMPGSADSGYTPWFYEILVEEKSKLKDFLKSRGIGTRDFYPPLHSEPAYGLLDRSHPVTEEISAKGLWLPSASKLSDDDVSYICAAIREYYSG